MATQPASNESNQEQFDNYGPMRGCLYMCAMMGGAALLITLLSYGAAWFFATK